MSVQPPKIDWNQIDTVIFDMDGTLLDLNFDNQFWLTHVPACYAKKRGLDLQSAKQIIFPKMQAVRGSLDWYNIHYWSEQLGLDILSLKQDLLHLIKTRPGVHPFLTTLRRLNKKVWLATNAHRETIPIKLDRTGIRPYFSEIISSSELGVPKESTVFWHELNKKHPFDPMTSLFVDDNLSILRVAKAYGIKHLLSITLPDLSGANNTQDEFPSIDHFSDITPSQPPPSK